MGLGLRAGVAQPALEQWGWGQADVQGCVQQQQQQVVTSPCVVVSSSPCSFWSLSLCLAVCLSDIPVFIVEPPIVPGCLSDWPSAMLCIHN